MLLAWPAFLFIFPLPLKVKTSIYQINVLNWSSYLWFLNKNWLVSKIPKVAVYIRWYLYFFSQMYFWLSTVHSGNAKGFIFLTVQWSRNKNPLDFLFTVLGKKSKGVNAEWSKQIREFGFGFWGEGSTKLFLMLFKQSHVKRFLVAFYPGVLIFSFFSDVGCTLGCINMKLFCKLN